MLLMSFMLVGCSVNFDTTGSDKKSEESEDKDDDDKDDDDKDDDDKDDDKDDDDKDDDKDDDDDDDDKDDSKSKKSDKKTSKKSSKKSDDEKEDDDDSWESIGGESEDEEESLGDDTVLSAKELNSIEKKLNEIGYYGFLLSYYSDPCDINWNSVFYVGAGFDQGTPSNKIVRAYLKETGEDEVYTDLTTVSGKDVKSYVKKTTGHKYSEMNRPLDWVYLKDYDLYIFEHGDTNQANTEVISGTLEGDTYTITYENYAGRGIVSFDDVDGTYRFNFNEPEGDIDQSEITDGMIFPDSDSRKLTKEDLKGLDKDQLKKARNEIYARHGRKFKNKDLQAYFETMEWYFPTVEADDFDDSVLNEYELYNLKFIGKYEK